MYIDVDQVATNSDLPLSKPRLERSYANTKPLATNKRQKSASEDWISRFIDSFTTDNGLPADSPFYGKSWLLSHLKDRPMRGTTCGSNDANAASTLTAHSHKSKHLPRDVCGRQHREEETSRPLAKRVPVSKDGFRVVERRYTIGDCFCGTGGVSRGAVMAGL